MKRIETSSEKEKKESRNKLVIGIILVGILILSTAGYAFFSNERINTRSGESVTYKNILFEKGTDSYWHAFLQGYNFYFSFNPKETENISAILSLNLNSYAGKPLYFSYGSDALGISEIARNIGNIAERVQYACINYNCSEDLPVKNCSNNIVSVQSANETLIRQEENCIYILAKQEDILKASDKFIFKILGVD